MNKNAFAVAALIVLLGVAVGKVYASEPQTQSQVVTQSEEITTIKASAQSYTGNVTVRRIFQPKQPDALFAGAIAHFEPGARTNWHLHPAGQHLVVLDGVGRTGTDDGTIVEFKAGDVIWCPKDIRHWHGAAPDQSMTHLALTGSLPDRNAVKWMEPVTDEQYNGQK